MATLYPVLSSLQIATLVQYKKRYSLPKSLNPKSLNPKEPQSKRASSLVARHVSTEGPERLQTAARQQEEETPGVIGP